MTTTQPHPLTLTIIDPEDNGTIAQWTDETGLLSSLPSLQEPASPGDPSLSLAQYLPQEAIADADAWNPNLLVTVCVAARTDLLNQINAIPTPIRLVERTVAYSEMTVQDAADLKAAVWHTDRTVHDRTEVTFPVNVPVDEDAETQAKRTVLRTMIQEVDILASFFKLAVGHRYLLQNSLFQQSADAAPTSAPTSAVVS